MSRRKRSRNPNQFTTDQIQTATLIETEGSLDCRTLTTKKDKAYTYRYPRIAIGMCNRQALEPAEKVFGTHIYADRSTEIQCPPELFPPEGKGRWKIEAVAGTAKRTMQSLDPLLTDHTKKRWKKIQETCK